MVSDRHVSRCYVVLKSTSSQSRRKRSEADTNHFGDVDRSDRFLSVDLHHACRSYRDGN